MSARTITLHHYTTPVNLAGIYAQEQLIPNAPDPSWISGDKAVVWLTDGGRKWYPTKAPLIRVTVEVERSAVTFCGDDPALRAAYRSVRHEPDMYNRAIREWWWSEKPIPTSAITELVQNGQRYGSASWDGTELTLQPFEVAS